MQQLMEGWDKLMVLHVRCGVLYRTGGVESQYVPVLPRGIRADVFERLHRSMGTLTHGQVLKLVRQDSILLAKHSKRDDGLHEAIPQETSATRPSHASTKVTQQVLDEI